MTELAARPRRVERPPVSRTASRSGSVPVVLVLLMAIAAAAIFYVGRGLTFHLDEWALVFRRGWAPDIFLQSHIEHLYLFPILIFKGLLATVGMAHYWVFRLVVIAFHLACVALVFVLARRRAGERLALVAATLILFLGTGWENLLWPLQVSFLGSLVAGLGMLLALERGDRVGDLAASVLVTVALASSGVGVAVAAMAAAEVALRREWRRLWLVAVPLLAYAIWFAAYGSTALAAQGSARINVTSVPAYVLDAAAASLAGLVGLHIDWGRPLLAAVVVLAFLYRRHALTVRFQTLAAGALAFWALTAVARAHLGAPMSSRYIYVGAVFVALMGVELLGAADPSPRTWAGIAVVLGVVVVAQIHTLRFGGRELRAHSGTLEAQLAALELARGRVDPAFALEPPGTVIAGPYFDAVDDYGSPAPSLAELASKPEPERQLADALLIYALDLRPRPLVRGPRCASWARAEPPVELTLRAGSVVIRAPERVPVQTRLRLFGDGYAAAPVRVLPPGSEAAIRIPLLGMRRPWHAQLSAQARFDVCVLRA